jgi:hypothetical protein
MEDLEEVPGVHGDITSNADPMIAPGEMERGITQDSLEISRTVRPSVFSAYSRNHIISQDSRNLQAQYK